MRVTKQRGLLQGSLFLTVSRLLAWCALVLGLAATAWGWHASAEQLREQADRSFDSAAAVLAARIDEKFEQYLDLLVSFQSLFHASEHVTRAEFRRHYEALQLRDRYRAALAIQYSRLVRYDEREAFEHRMNEELRAELPNGHPRYRIHPEGVREVYLPVVYNEPAAGNEVAMGFDSLGSVAHREFVEGARDRGEALASGPVELLQGGVGFVIRLPLYDVAHAPATPEARRAHYAGQVTGVFRIADVIEDAVVELDEHLRLRVEDVGPVPVPRARLGRAGTRLFYDSQEGVFQTANRDLRQHAMSLAGRLWVVQVARQPVVWGAQPLPLAILLGGALVSLFAFGILQAFAGRYSHAVRIAQQLDRRARHNARRLSAVIESSADAILTLDAQGVVRSANAAAQRMFGLADGHMIGRSMQDFLDDGVPADLAGRGLRETTATTAEGHRVPVEVSFNAMTLDGQRHYVGIVRDVSQWREAQARIQHMAQHDALTGLPNRALLEDRLAQAVERARRDGSRLALLFVDLDRFKNINDSLGHHVGDRVLCEVAARLGGAIRASDTVARMGGDEFVVLLPAISALEDAEFVARKILLALEAPVHEAGHELRVTASVGVAPFPECGQDAPTLMRHADSAMYRAKAAGRGTFRVHDPRARGPSVRRLQLESELHHALERGELLLHFQPQFDCADDTLVGAEALLRWQQQGGLVPPDEFVSLAEETGLIVPIGTWALQEACRQAQRWRTLYGRELRVAVNLSSRQLESEDLVPTVALALEASALPPGSLELELTESALLRDVPAAARTLHQLRALGVSLAIDDFGVGYSSFAYLRELPVHKIKIDRSFMAAMRTPEGDPRLVRALIAMAHSVEMEVVAEGVETEYQRALLKAHGCDVAQGYLLGRPVPAAAFERLLALRERAAAD